MKRIITFLLVLCLFPVTLVSATETVYIGGDSIGIEGEYDGVYISGTYQFTISDETINPLDTIQTKDVIIEVGKNKISSLQDFTSSVNKYQKVKNEIPIVVIRDNQKVHTTLISTWNHGISTCGLYLKEKVLGIGTMTFYNPDTTTYGALGHSITIENNEYITHGTVYESLITSIEKANKNNSGDKIGEIIFSNPLGDIDINSDIGIYGTYDKEILNKSSITTAESNEITAGPAEFYTVIKDNQIEKFKIQITDIDEKHLENSKAISFVITDKRLIKETGGIIHGMSGSPITQNGKLIGAITHVSSEDPRLGYAIYIGNMIKKSKP